jgi:hypothetical protein
MALGTAAALSIGLGLLGLWTLAPERFHLLGGTLLGVAGACLASYLRSGLPLRRVAVACRRIESGDLSRTVPIAGPRQLRCIARLINDMAADFQEVLLLFAHLLRSAQRSASLLALRESGRVSRQFDAGRVDELIADIRQMHEMIHDFKYFRVRVDTDAIVDTGIRSQPLP